MKKIGKMLSYFAKVFLVLGLLFTNLSGLSVVFAYEGTENFTVSVNDDKQIVINYIAELDDTDEITAKISENYTYLDMTSEGTGLEYSQSFVGNELKPQDVENITEEDGGKVLSSMLSAIRFDGLYELSVSLYNETDEEDLGTVIYSENITFESGLKFNVFDALSDEEILPVDGVYQIEEYKNVKTIVKVLSGGLTPCGVYEFDGNEYEGQELIDLEFSGEKNFSGLLFGEYTDNFTVSELKELSQEVLFSTDINYLYSDYSMNADVLNDSIVGTDYEKIYLFSADSKDGILHVRRNNDVNYSVNQLIDIIENAISGNDKITYNIINNGINLNEAYQEYLNSFDAISEESPLSREEYFETTYIDNTTVISLSSDELTITFSVIVYGDLNDDEIIDESDLQLLTDQFVGLSDKDSVKSDIYDDGILDAFDIMYLHQLLKNGNWFVEIDAVDAFVEAKLELVDEDPIETGDEFTVQYVVTVSDDAINGFSGAINYNATDLELVSIDVSNVSEEEGQWIGSNNDGYFMYVRNDSLTSKTVINEETESEEMEPVSYVLLTIKFKALASTPQTTIELLNAEFFNQDEYYVLDDMAITLDVEIDESSDSTLSSLVVAGQKIELQDGVFSYEITVESDVTSAEVEAIVNNIAASISSIVAPEELVEGENVISIAVMAENGDETIYTVTVIRKEEPKEETTQLNYQDNIQDDSNDKVVDVPVTDKDTTDDNDEDDEEDTKKSNVSRIIIVILILLVIAGLIYLIFKDEDDNDTKKVNKDINRLKKENESFESKKNEKINKNDNSNIRKNNKKGR